MEIIKELQKESRVLLLELRKIKEDSCKYYKSMELMSKEVLICLLDKAIDTIDSLQVDFEYNVRDVKDLLCDKEFIFEDLITESIKDYELFVED